MTIPILKIAWHLPGTCHQIVSEHSKQAVVFICFFHFDAQLKNVSMMPQCVQFYFSGERDRVSSLHWLVLVFFYSLFIQWSIKVIESYSPAQSNFTFLRYWNFLTNYDVICRKLNTCYYTPLLENEQKWAQKKSMEATAESFFHH